MKQRDKDVRDIIQALNDLGFSVDHIDLLAVQGYPYQVKKNGEAFCKEGYISILISGADHTR